MHAPDEASGERKRRADALWRADRQVLMLASPFLGVLAMRLDLVAVVDDRLPTAFTDGRSIFGHADFLLGLTDAERLFVLAHEVWHCALRHHARRLGRERRRWNVAVDHEVNALLREQGFQAPEGAVHFPDYAGWSAEEVYEVVTGRGAHPGGGLRRIDIHELEDDAPDGVRDPDLAPAEDTAIWRCWGERVTAAMQQAGRGPGQLPGSVRQRLEASVRPRVAWRQHLRCFLTQTPTAGFRWTPPARRHWGRGWYLPGRRGEALDVVVAVDTSGSTARLWGQFRSELGGLLRAFREARVRLVLFDTRVTHDAVHGPEHPLPQALTFAGGGGTDLRAPFEHLAANDRPVIVFTDGYGPMPERPPRAAVLWLLAGESRCQPAWGRVVRLPKAT